jgi:hypothetical protein
MYTVLRNAVIRINSIYKEISLGCKNIVIITSEPLGAYHIMPMHEEMRLRFSKFTHLIPYPEDLQGEPWVNISTSLSIIDSCDRVILAGGGFSAWSEAVLSYANGLGKPIHITELAYGSFVAKPNLIKINKVSVLTPASKNLICETLPINPVNVSITGSPQTALNIDQKGGLVLLLSTSDMLYRDFSTNLIQVANYLEEKKIPYIVRCHPREDKSLWDGHPLSTSPLLSDDLALAKIVVAYSGTPSLNVVASGIPLINLAPNDNFTSIIPEIYNSILLNWASNFDDVITLLDKSSLPDLEIIEALLGNNDKAAKQIVDFWESE